MLNWRSGTVLRIRVLSIAGFSAFFLTLSFGQQGSAPSEPGIAPDDLMRKVVANEIKSAESDHSRWMYQQHRIEDDKNTVKECVDTTQGALCRLLAHDGHALSQVEHDKERERLVELVKDPEQQRRMQEARTKDGDQALKMLKMLPAAFHYQYADEEGSLVRLKFAPNPDFNPPDRESRVLHAMVGFMWIDCDSMRLAEINGKLIRDVDFGFGLLGHLYRGGTFQVKRSDVGRGHWETTLLDVKIRGKALFFKTINADQQETTSDFKEVPTNLSMTQAMKMLEPPGHSLEAKAVPASR